MGRRWSQLVPIASAACALAVTAAGCQPSCRDREDLARDALADIARDPGLTECDADDECVIGIVRLDCFAHWECDPWVSIRRDSVDRVGDRLNAVNDEHCADFAEECGGSGAAHLCLPPPGEAACVDGRCTGRGP